MQQLNEFFLCIKPLKYINKKTDTSLQKHLLLTYFVGRNLSLVSCSPAELTSVSVPYCKVQKRKLYLQTV